MTSRFFLLTDYSYICISIKTSKIMETEKHFILTDEFKVNAKGGCSTYRNVEFMNSETRRMQEAFLCYI